MLRALVLLALLAACGTPPPGSSTGGGAATAGGSVTAGGSGTAGGGAGTAGGGGMGSAGGTASGAPNHPLIIAMPRAMNTAPEAGAPAISPSHRSFWAYPGLPYVIRAAVQGGHYPYAYALQNAPAGMTIDARTGEIRWPDPQADAANIGLNVTDASGATAQTTWSIDVDASRFIFVSASAASGGNGSLASPYQRLSAIPESAHAGKVLYLRSGTYDVLDLPRSGANGAWLRVEWGSTKPTSWLAYPGEAPVLDFGFQPASGSDAPFIRISGPAVWLEGLEARNANIMMFQFGTNHYAVVRNNRMHTHGPGVDGSNAAFVMTLRGGNQQAHYMAFQDNDFSGGRDAACLKFYSNQNLLIEGNTFHDHTQSVGEGECLALKDSCLDFTVRGNLFYAMGSSIKTIGGNMNNDEVQTRGEILFNNVRAGSINALDLNQNGTLGSVWVYRNTFAGRIRVRNTDAADGPFTLYQNVIVNADTGTPPGSHIHHESVSAPGQIILRDNLTGAPGDGIIDANGSLTGSYVQYRGTRGHE